MVAQLKEADVYFDTDVIPADSTWHSRSWKPSTEVPDI